MNVRHMFNRNTGCQQTIGELFIQFFKYGLFTFGGGMSIVAQIQKDYVDEKQILTNEDILNLTSVGRSLPGTLIGNVAIMFGYHLAGVGGSIACLFGIAIPPIIILSIITYFYAIVQKNPYVISIMSGVRASVVPIIFCAILRMFKSAFPYPPCYFVTLLTFVLYYFFSIGCIPLVFAGAVLGLLISEYYEKKRSKKIIFLELFWSFVKIGYTSFGGLSMIALIRSEMLTHGWMTEQEVSDIVAIAEMTPGPLALNCATFVGVRMAGVAGAVLSNLGVLMPSLTIALAAAVFFEKFRQSRLLDQALVGIRSSCVGIIASVIVSLSLSNYAPSHIVDPKSIVIGLISLYLLKRKDLSIPKVIGISALLGLLLY